MPRCDDCGHRIWSHKALKRRFGLHLGDTCYRRRAAHHRRITIRISYTPPGDIPGQIDLLEST